MKIGICGFGIAGGALATLLGRAGHRVTLLEQAPRVGPVGAGFLLQPAGQRVLAQLGLAGAVISRGARIHRLEAFTPRGHQLTDLRYAGAGPDLCAYGIPRDVIFAALHESARAAGAEIVLAAEIVEVKETPESVELRDASGRSHGPFDLVIAADGSRSRLRAALNPDARRREYIDGALWASGPLAEPQDHLHQVTRGTERLAGLLPIGGGKCAFFWGIRRGDVGALRARGFASFCDEVAALCPRARPLVESLAGFDALAFAGYLHALPRRVHTARVVLAGDAAHAMSPHLGQGANLALLDAECLARHLATLPRPAALAAYARERRAHNRYLGLLSRGLSPFFQSPGRTLGWARDLALPLLCATPFFRRQMELTVAGVKRGFFDQIL